MEMLLQLPPLTPHDATASVMFPAFAATPDLRPYVPVVPDARLDARNPPRSAAVAMDFSAPDRIPDEVLTAALWQALRGVPPPPPTRAAFLASQSPR
jgi:hypothetical protein